MSATESRTRLEAAAPQLFAACERALWLVSDPEAEDEDAIGVEALLRAAIAAAKGEA